MCFVDFVFVVFLYGELIKANVSFYVSIIVDYECKECFIVILAQPITVIMSTKSEQARCTDLKDVFEGLESFEFIGIRQTKFVDELVFSWNGSEKFNANTRTDYIKTFITKSKLKLPENKSWTTVNWGPYTTCKLDC